MAPLPNYRCPILLRTAENSRVRALVFVAAHESVGTFRTCRPPLTNVGYQGKSGSNSDIAKSTRLAPLRHAYGHQKCLLVGVDRKWSAHGRNDASDSDRTWAGPCGSVSDIGFELLRCCLQSSEDGREATRFRHVARRYGVGMAVVLGKRPKPVVSKGADVVV